MRAPATKSSPAGISRIETVTRLCASRRTPTLTARGSAFAGWIVIANIASVAAKNARNTFSLRTKKGMGKPCSGDACRRGGGRAARESLVFPVARVRKHTILALIAQFGDAFAGVL